MRRSRSCSPARHARAGDAVACAGMLAAAALCAAHARLTARREWARNEKRLIQRAGLGAVQPLLARPGGTAAELTATVSAVAAMLELGRCRSADRAGGPVRIH